MNTLVSTLLILVFAEVALGLACLAILAARAKFGPKLPDLLIQPFFRWFDLWAGVYVDVPNRAVYICPIPMFGLKLQLRPAEGGSDAV